MFSATFKRTMGITPARFRAMHSRRPERTASAPQPGHGADAAIQNRYPREADIRRDSERRDSRSPIHAAMPRPVFDETGSTGMFSATFQRTMGITPARFREMHSR